MRQLLCRDVQLVACMPQGDNTTQVNIECDLRTGCYTLALERGLNFRGLLEQIFPKTFEYPNFKINGTVFCFVCFGFFKCYF